PIDVTIPEPGAAPKPAAAAAAGGTAPAPAAASTPEGLALVRKVRDFVGGKAKIDAIKTVRKVSAMSMKTPAGPMEAEAEEIVQYPDMHRSVMKLPMGEMTMVSTPDAAFIASPMGTQEMPASQREMQSREWKTDLIAVLKNVDNPKYVFTLSAPDTLDINAD